MTKMNFKHNHTLKFEINNIHSKIIIYKMSLYFEKNMKVYTRTI